VNREKYNDVLRRLRGKVRRKRAKKWRTNSWFLFHDNALAHPSVLVKDFLGKNNITTLEHPHTLLTRLYLIFPLTEISIEGTALL